MAGVGEGQRRQGGRPLGPPPRAQFPPRPRFEPVDREKVLYGFSYFFFPLGFLILFSEIFLLILFELLCLQTCPLLLRVFTKVFSLFKAMA